MTVTRSASTIDALPAAGTLAAPGSNRDVIVEHLLRTST